MQVVQNFVQDNLLLVMVGLGLVVLLMIIIIVASVISGHKEKKYDEIPDESESETREDEENPDNSSDQPLDENEVDDEDEEDIEVEEIDEAVPQQESEKTSEINVSSEQSHEKVKKDEKTVETTSEKGSEDFDEEDDEDNDDTFVIEKSAQAHAKRHEKREWQRESDQDKFDKKAYSQGVEFKYAPNKEPMNKYKDLLDSEELTKKSKEEDEKALLEIKAKEDAEKEAQKLEDNFKKDTTSALEKMSKKIDELAATVCDEPKLSIADIEQQSKMISESYVAQQEQVGLGLKSIVDLVNEREESDKESFKQMNDVISNSHSEITGNVEAVKFGVQSLLNKKEIDYSNEFVKVGNEINSINSRLNELNNEIKGLQIPEIDLSSIVEKLNSLEAKIAEISVPTETEVKLDDESFLHRHKELMDRLDSIITKQEENAREMTSSFKGTHSLSQKRGSELEKIKEAINSLAVSNISVPDKSEQKFETESEKQFDDKDAEEKEADDKPDPSAPSKDVVSVMEEINETVKGPVTNEAHNTESLIKDEETPNTNKISTSNKQTETVEKEQGFEKKEEIKEVDKSEEKNNSSTQPRQKLSRKQRKALNYEKKVQEEAQNKPQVKEPKKAIPVPSKQPQKKEAPKQNVKAAPKKKSAADIFAENKQKKQQQQPQNKKAKKPSTHQIAAEKRQVKKGLPEERLKEMRDKEEAIQKRIDNTLANNPVLVMATKPSSAVKMTKEEIATFRQRGMERYEKYQKKLESRSLESQNNIKSESEKQPESESSVEISSTISESISEPKEIKSEAVSMLSTSEPEMSASDIVLSSESIVEDLVEVVPESQSYSDVRSGEFVEESESQETNISSSESLEDVREVEAVESSSENAPEINEARIEEPSVQSHAQRNDSSRQSYTRQGFRIKDSAEDVVEETRTVRASNRASRPGRATRTNLQTSSRPSRPTRAHR